MLPSVLHCKPDLKSWDIPVEIAINSMVNKAVVKTACHPILDNGPPQ